MFPSNCAVKLRSLLDIFLALNCVSNGEYTKATSKQTNASKRRMTGVMMP
jgi:hypothetical protein